MATIGVLALLTSAGFAQEGNIKTSEKQERAYVKHGKRGGLMADISDLTEEQKAQIKSIREDGRKKMEPQRKEMKVLRMKLMDMKSAENPNIEEIDRMIDDSAALKAEMEKTRTASELKVRGLLTPEQRKSVNEKRKENRAKREEEHKQRRKMMEAK